MGVGWHPMALGTRILFRKLAKIVTALAALAAASGWVFYADDRRPSYSNRIGTLAIELPEGSGTGTAFLVGECGILTNFHVVFGPWYVTALRPPSHEFTATFTLTEVTLPDGSHPSARAIPVVWGDYQGADRLLRRPQEDWAYLTLDRCLGAQYGYFELRDAAVYEPPVDRGFTATGYSAGRQMLDPRCEAHADDMGGQAWVHDCALLPGDSGGPIFRKGTLTVVALASGYRTRSFERDCQAIDPGSSDVPLLSWGLGCANIAVPISDAMRDRICQAATAVGVQHQLSELGYDVGPIGAIETPVLADAVRRAERDLGWPVTGTPTPGLLKNMLLLRPRS